MHRMATIPRKPCRRDAMHRSRLVRLTVGLSLAALMVWVAVLPAEAQDVDSSIERSGG
jgi:hypothetical protein